MGPVRLTGERIAPRLVDRLLNERLDTRDDQPILQHVLMRCWDAWAGQAAEQPAGSGNKPDHRGPIDIRHYEQVHTIHGALNAHAGEALEELGSEDRDPARRLFQALTQVDSGNRRIRRPTRLSDLCAITGTPEPWLRYIIDCFRQGGRNFLVFSRDQDPMVDISHESLIRQWDSLRSWVDEEATNADIYRRLAETAAKHTPAEPRFYRDAELQEAIDWHRHQKPTAAWAQRYRPGFQPALDFLRESRLLRIQEHRERRRIRIEREQERAERGRLLRKMAEQEQENAKLAQQKAEQDRRARRTARNWSLGLGVLAVLMLLLAGYAFQKTRIAEEAEQAATVAAKQAELERNRAEEQFLKASINLARVHEEKAVALLELAFNTEHTSDYQRALLHALQAQRQPIRGQAGLQPTGRDRLTDSRIAGAFREQWRSPTPRLDSTPNGIAWSSDGNLMATAQADGSIRLWAAATGRPLHTLTGHEKSVTSVDFSLDGKLLASASKDGTVRLWDPRRREHRSAP